MENYYSKETLGLLERLTDIKHEICKKVYFKDSQEKSYRIAIEYALSELNSLCLDLLDNRYFKYDLIKDDLLEVVKMNRQDFIKSNNEIDYVAYASYLEQENRHLKSKKPYKDLKERNDKLVEQYRLCEIRKICLEQENKQLKEQLKQRDDVIDEAMDNINLVIELIKQQPASDDSWILQRLNSFIIILNKYKGDKK